MSLKIVCKTAWTFLNLKLFLLEETENAEKCKEENVNHL